MRRSARTYTFCGMRVSSDIPLPPLRPGRGPAQCVISLDTSAKPLGAVTWFHEWRKPRGPLWLSFGRLDNAYVLRFAEQLADFVISADATRIVARPSPTLPADTLRHLLIDQVLPLVASRRGHLSLHASAVHIRGIGTIGFVGEAGRGKSTLAAALAARGARIVTDDCLAIDVGERPPVAVPGYPGLRLFPGAAATALLGAIRSSRVAHYSTKQRIDRGAATFHPQRSPLRALFLLSPRSSAGAAAAIRRCRASLRLMGLLRYAYVLDVEDRRDLAVVFAGLSKVAASVPVMRLRVRNGSRHLSAAAALIQEFASGA